MQSLWKPLAPKPRSCCVTLILLTVCKLSPNLCRRSCTSACPPNLIIQALTSHGAASPLTRPGSPWFHYLLAVHSQILSIDFHPHNDYLIIPLPTDGCVPEAARVQRGVNTPNDLGRRRGRYRSPSTEGRQVTRTASNRTSHFWGWQGPL